MEESALVRLSPSRASDFKSCPQLFKFRAVDRLPEPPDPLAALGTLVHVVLERLLRLPPAERTLGRAAALLDEAWAEAASTPEMFPPTTPDEDAARLARARRLVSNYFRVEDPRGVDAYEVEWSVEHRSDGAVLRGVIDRVEVLPDGEWVLTDYKTGSSPSETYALDAFFGLRFYALVCWRAFDRLPRELRLIHLREPEVVTLIPTTAMLEALERQLHALGLAIRRAHRSGDWRPRPGPRCSFCPHKAICPAFAAGGVGAERAAAG